VLKKVKKGICSRPYNKIWRGKLRRDRHG